MGTRAHLRVGPAGHIVLSRATAVLCDLVAGA